MQNLRPFNEAGLVKSKEVRSKPMLYDRRGARPLHSSGTSPNATGGCGFVGGEPRRYIWVAGAGVVRSVFWRRSMIVQNAQPQASMYLIDTIGQK